MSGNSGSEKRSTIDKAVEVLTSVTGDQAIYTTIDQFDIRRKPFFRKYPARNSRSDFRWRHAAPLRLETLRLSEMSSVISLLTLSGVIRTRRRLILPIGKKVKLLLLDPVFHLSAGAIDFFIKILSIIVKIGDDESIIGGESVEFRFGNDPARIFPGSCCVPEFSKQFCFFICFIISCFCFDLKFL